MSTSLEYQARRALRAIASRVGTAPVSVALLALAVIYLVVATAWAHRGTGEAAERLVRSFAFDALSAVLVADALVGMLRAVSRRDRAAGPVRGRAAARAWGRLLLRASYLLVAGAFVASTLAHDELTMRLAVGERATGAADELVAAQPPRSYSRGPFPVAFRVESVAGTPRADGSTEGLAVTLRSPDGDERTLRRWRPLWVGFGRLLVPIRAGHALRYTISVEGGGVLESGILKLDLLPPGRHDEVRSEVIPHRIVYAIAAARDTGPTTPVQAMVFRSRLLVAEGRLDPGAKLRFDGLVLAVPEIIPWVELEMIRDPGIGVAVLALVVAAVAAVVLLASRERRRAAP